jgi:predicted dehydrogenase
MKLEYVRVRTTSVVSFSHLVGCMVVTMQGDENDQTATTATSLAYCAALRRAVSSLTMMSPSPESERNSNSRAIGVAIVGCGQIVTHHLAAMALLLNNNNKPRFVLRALVDPLSERRRIIADLPASQVLRDDDDAPTVAHYDSLDQLLSSMDDDDNASRNNNNIQIIFIAVPHDLHESLCLQALQCRSSSILVVLEKPLAPTRVACDNLLQASSRSLSLASSSHTTTNNNNNNMLVMAEQSPHWPEVVLARQWIHDEAAIGTVLSASAYYYESMRTNTTSGDTTSGGALGWRGSLARAGGGIVLDGGLHWIRPLRELLGRVRQVFAVARRNLQPQLQLQGESLAHAIFQIEAPAATTNQENEDDDDAANNRNHPLIQPPGSGPLLATYSCHMLATAPMAHDCCPYFRITGSQGEILIHGDGLLPVPGRSWWCATLQ